jgi:hypothetical protein
MLGHIFLVIGVLLLLAAALASIAAGTSLVERMRFGPGLMFADVEMLAILAFFLGGAGATVFWLGKRLLRGHRADG